MVVSLGDALHVGSKSCLYGFTELNFLSVGSPVGSQDIETILIDIDDNQLLYLNGCGVT